MLGRGPPQASSCKERIMTQTAQRKPKAETLKLVGWEPRLPLAVEPHGIAVVVSFQPSGFCSP